MKILILYYKEPSSLVRKTIDEHLYSFKKYADADCYYVNIVSGIPACLVDLYFDLIILHYTACACRFQIGFFNNIETKWQRLSEIKGYKAAIPQDEYVNTDSLCNMFKYFGIKTVFTCLPESEWRKVYPFDKSGVENFLTVLTGYIDEEIIHSETINAFSDRDIDLGYRARKNPYSLGSHANLKWQLAEQFVNNSGCKNLKFDISTAPDDVFYGDTWYAFLRRCRTILGCEGGASLHDPDGSIELSVNRYLSRYPDASFEEVEQNCFPGQDGNLKLFALSPRHFEACMTRTCQILVEGQYGGILKPNIHYIELKKDWSNISDVLDKVRDVSYCTKIAEKSYQDIVMSGRYTYRNFVNLVIDHVKSLSAYNSKAQCYAPKWRYSIIMMHNCFSWMFMLPVYARVVLRKPLRRAFELIGYPDGYQKLRALILK